MRKKTFPLNVVLSVTTGRLLCDFSDMHECMETLAGEPVWTHQLPRVLGEVKPWLSRWFPELEAASHNLDRLDSVLDSEDDPANVVRLFCEWCRREGNMQHEYEIGAIPRDDHDSIDPVTELVQIRGGTDGIIVVEKPDES